MCSHVWIWSDALHYCQSAYSMLIMNVTNYLLSSSDVDTDGIDTDSTTTVEEVVEFFVKEEITVIE